MKSMLQKTIGPVALVLGILVVLELVFRLLLPFIPGLDAAISPRPPIVHPELPDSVLGFRPNPDYPGHDARGYRNEEALASADIVCLGDSQTYGTGVPSSAAWPQVLGTHLGAPVYSLSFGGYAPTHYLTLLDSAIAMEPKVIIEAFYSGNDLWGCFENVYIHGQHRDLRSQDDSLSATVTMLESQNSIKTQAAMIYWGTPTPPPVPDNTAQPLPFRHRIKTYLAYRAAKKKVQAALRTVPSRDDLWARSVVFANQNPQLCEVYDAKEPRTIFTPQLRSLGLDRRDPRIEEGYRIALATIERMRDRSVEQGSRFVVLLIPTKEFVFRELVRTGDVGPSENYKALIAHESAFWEDCKLELRAQDIEHIDMSVPLAQSIERGESPYHQSHDGHPSVVGHQVIANQVIRWLEEHQIQLGR